MNSQCVCDSTSCPTGCCSSGTCVTTLTPSQCGTNGAACTSCDATKANNCGNGACRCGTSAACGVGQRCFNSACVCDATSCPGGCCNGGVCNPASVTTCGTAGGACTACNTTTADTCAAGGCRCGSGAPCGAGTRCFAGACVCDGTSCPGGCCQGTTCTTATFPTCGVNGAACQSCSATSADRCLSSGSCGCGAGSPCGAGQRCSSGACVCDGTTCASGCCAGNTCQTPSLSQCGTSGAACVTCDSTRANLCTTGACRCGTNPMCTSDKVCLAGGCECVAGFSSGAACAGAVKVSAGVRHSCAVLADGSMRCWGSNNFLQLGHPATVVDSTRALPLPGIVASAVDCGAWHTCVLGVGATGDTGQCWGGNASGKAVGGLPFAGVSALAAGGDATCIKTLQSGARCVGSNADGLLGNGGVAVPLNTFADVTGLTNITSIDSDYNHACAVQGGQVSCWGGTFYGVTSTTDGGTAQLVPRQIAGITNALSVVSGHNFACALLASGTVTCWGERPGTLVKAAPATVPGLSNVIALAGGYATACALVSSGQVYCWGNNTYGQLGTGNLTHTTAPTVPVVGLTGVTSLAMGQDHACAVVPSGDVRCWGFNMFGQLGNGTNAYATTPTRVLSAP